MEMEVIWKCQVTRGRRPWPLVNKEPGVCIDTFEVSAERTAVALVRAVVSLMRRTEEEIWPAKKQVEVGGEFWSAVTASASMEMYGGEFPITLRVSVK